MRILQLFNPYSHFGGEEGAYEQISAELESNHDLKNITFDIQPWIKESSPFSRVKQLCLMALNPCSIRKVRTQIREFKPDIILLHNIMPVGSAALYLYLSRLNIPTVHYIHNFRPFSVSGYCWGNNKILPEGLHLNFLPEIQTGSWQGSKVKTAYYALLLRSLHALGVYKRIDGWIAISSFMKETFVKGGIDAEKITTIPHSWKPENAEILRSDQDAPISPPSFLFLGRISEEKGVNALLDAWEIYQEKGGVGILKIAGEGPLSDEISSRCQQLPSAHFLGFTTGEDKQSLLASCTAMIVPSLWWEPLGLVLYEAYSHGKPVLAAKSGGIVDHVIHGETGWIHEPGDTHQLANQILHAAHNPEECKTLGLKGRDRVKLLDPAQWIIEFNRFAEKIIQTQGNTTPVSKT